MALQTKTYTQSSNTFTLELTLVEQSTSTAGNSSTLSYTLKLKSTTKNFAQYGVGAAVKLDNQTVAVRDRGSAPKITLGTRSEVTLLSGTRTVAHNSDGSKAMALAYSMDMASASYTPGPMSGSGTMTLTKIPRGATITSAPNFTDEDDPVVKVSNPAGVSVQLGIFKDSTHALADYRTISGTSYTFRLTQAEREAMRKVDTTKNTAQVRFYVKSTVGGQQFIFFTTRTVTIKNPAPTLSPSIRDVNPMTVALTGDPSVMVRYASNAQVVTGAKAVKGATLMSQKVTCGAKTLNRDGTINAVESGTFVLSAIDSRGNTTIQTVKKSLIPYIVPTCYIGQGVPNALGQYDLAVSGDCFNGDFGAAENQITAEFRFAPKGTALGDDWMPMTVSPAGSGYTATANIVGLDYRTTYIFQARVTDRLGTVESDTKIVVSRAIAEWGEDYWKFNVPVSLAETDDDGTTTTRGLARNGITVRIASTVSLSGGEKKIPLAASLCAYGGAKLSNGDAVVKNSGVYEVSGSVYFASTADALYCGAYIKSGGDELASMHTGIANGVGGVVVPPTLVELEAGSTVSLSAYVPTGGSATVNNDPRTQLTVRQVY